MESQDNVFCCSGSVYFMISQINQRFFYDNYFFQLGMYFLYIKASPFHATLFMKIP